MKVPAMRNMEERISPLTTDITSRCTWETSLVTRVMRDPVVKESVCSKDIPMIREKQAFLTSLP